MKINRIDYTITPRFMHGKDDKSDKKADIPTLGEAETPFLEVIGYQDLVFAKPVSINFFLNLLKDSKTFKNLNDGQRKAFEILEVLAANIPQNTEERFKKNVKEFVEAPSISKFYATAIEAEYAKLRLANYPVLESESKDIAEFTSRDLNGIYNYCLRGWHQRFMKENVLDNSKTRISINACADSELIKNLDKILIEDENIIAYKTPDTFEGWHHRHDPVTIYLEEDPSHEFIEKLIKAVEGHIRSDKNLIGDTITGGMTIDKTPTEKFLNDFIKEIAQYDKYFAQYLKEFYFRDCGTLNTSTGKVQAVKNVLSTLKQNFPESNSFSKTVGLFSFDKNSQRTVDEFINLADKKYLEWSPFLPDYVLEVFFKIKSNPAKAEKSEMLMDFIRKFPNVEEDDADYIEKLMSELSKIS